MTRLTSLRVLMAACLFTFSTFAIAQNCDNPSVSSVLTDDCVQGTFNINIGIGTDGSAVFYDVFYSVNDDLPIFSGSVLSGSNADIGEFLFGDSVDVIVQDPTDVDCGGLVYRHCTEYNG